LFYIAEHIAQAIAIDDNQLLNRRKHMKTLITLLTLMLFLSCNKGGDGGIGLDGKKYDHEDEAYAAITAMNEEKGANRYSLVKLKTLIHNHIVVYDSKDGEYEAWDIGGYRVGLGPKDTYERIKTDGRYKDLDAQPFDFFWDGDDDLLFSEIAAAKKDLEAMGASIEESNTQTLAEIYSANFGLSEVRAFEVAKLSKTYAKIKRSLTATEKDVFSNKLLGMGYKEVNHALLNGSGYDELLDRAADLNGISPEAVNVILKEML
jgi:hypothetical protein